MEFSNELLAHLAVQHLYVEVSYIRNVSWNVLINVLVHPQYDLTLSYIWVTNTK